MPIRPSPALVFTVLLLALCSLPLVAAEPASQPASPAFPNQPLDWVPADANLVVQGRQLDRWLSQSWLPALIGVLDSVAQGKDTGIPAWCGEVFGPLPPQGTGKEKDKRRALAWALRTLFSGRFTLVTDFTPERVDSACIFELPPPASAPASPRPSIDPRWNGLVQALGWQSRSKDPNRPVYYWPRFNVVLYLREAMALAAPAHSPLAQRLMDARGWTSDQVATSPAVTRPARLVDLAAFQSLFRPAAPGELSGFYQPDREPNEPTIPGGMFLTVLSAAGTAKVQEHRMSLDLAVNLSPAAARALAGRPMLLGLAGPGKQPTTHPTSQPAPVPATSQPWNDVSGTLAVWQGPLYFPRQVEEWQEITPQAAPLVLTLEAIAPKLNIQRDLLDGLGEQVVLIWSRSPVERDQEIGGLSYPCLAVAVPLRENEQFHLLLDNLPKVVNPLLSALGPKPEVAINRVDLQPTVYLLPIGRLLKGHLNRNIPAGVREVLEHLELVWGVKNGWLVMGTDLDLVRRCLLAQSQPPEKHKTVLRRESPGSINFRLRPAEACKLLGDWLDYLAKTKPETMTEGWWKKQLEGPAPHPPRIGAVVQTFAPASQPTTAPAGLLEVVAVFPGTPADGALQIGDRIWAVNDRPLDPKRPRADLAQVIFDRSTPGIMPVKLSFYRGNQALEAKLMLPPLPDMGPNPLAQLRLWARVFDVMQEFNFSQHQTGKLLRVQAEVVWKK